jgi:hypothetical protein
MAFNETLDVVFDGTLLIPNYTLPKSVDREYAWTATNTTEQKLEEDSLDFDVTWVPHSRSPRLRFRAERVLEAATYTIQLTSSKML